jgi:hypothetical protein
VQVRRASIRFILSRWRLVPLPVESRGGSVETASTNRRDAPARPRKFTFLSLWSGRSDAWYDADRFSRYRSTGGEPVKQDVVLVASENAETRQELAERLDWDDVPFHLASGAFEALAVLGRLAPGTRLFVVLDFQRRSRARVMDALRARGDLDVQLLLLHDAQDDGLTDEKVVEHVRRPAVARYLYSLVERHAHGAVA